MMMIPEAFGPRYHISIDKRAFYEYHAAMIEPWDGPAAMVFTDGRLVGGTLDRNGLRPCRYTVTTDGLVVLASEAGVIEFPPERIRQKGRLQPGRMFLVDTQEGRIVVDNEVKGKIARQKPYRRWLEQNLIELRGLFQPSRPLVDRPRVAGPAAAGLRLYAGGAATDPGADGLQRAGAGGLDGHRHAAGGALGRAEAAVLLFQAALRPGHQPAHRPAAGRAGDVADVVHRQAAEPAGGVAGALPPAQAAPPDPDQRGRLPAAGGEARRLQGGHAAGRVRGRRSASRPCPAAGAGAAGRGGGEGDPRGRVAVDRQRPRRFGVQGPHSQPAGHRRAAPRVVGPAAEERGGDRRGKRRAPRGDALLPAVRLRGQRHQSLPGVRGHPPPPRGRRPAARRRAGRVVRRVHHGREEGHPQDDVEDGHLHAPQLPLGAAVRGRGPGPRGDRPVFPRHGVADRRRGAGHVGPRGVGPAPGGLRSPPLRALDLEFGGEYHFRLDGERHLWNPTTISRLQHAVLYDDQKAYDEYRDAPQRTEPPALYAPRPVRAGSRPSRCRWRRSSR